MGTDHHVIYISVLGLGKLCGSLSDPVCIDNNFTEKLIFYFLCGKHTGMSLSVYRYGLCRTVILIVLISGVFLASL